MPVTNADAGRVDGCGRGRSAPRRGNTAPVDTDSVLAYIEDMNLTISIDDEVVRRARVLARKQGKSLQQVIREHLESLTAPSPPAELADRLFEVMDSTPGRSGGARFRREDTYAGRA